MKQFVLTVKPFSIILFFVLAGCNGGLIGTSSGPTDSGSDIVVLPNKVAPRVPSSLVSNSLEKTFRKNNFVQARSVDNVAGQGNIARSWQTLSPVFSKAEVTRIALELELKLLDSVFGQIVSRCGSLEGEPCVFDDGELEVEFTQALFENYVDTEGLGVNTRQRLSVLQLMTQAGISVGDLIRVGGIEISQLNDDIYAFRIQINALSFLATEAVQLDWSSDFTDIRYTITTGASEHAEKFHFQTLPDAQKLTMDAVLDGFVDPKAVSIELATGEGVHSERFLFNANVAGNTIAGQAIDTAAYTLLFDYGDDFSDAVYLQEKFGAGGEISEASSCNFDNLQAACLTSNLLDSNFSFSGEDFENAIAGFGFADVAVEDLPDNVGHFEIQSATDISADGAPVVYCDVWQPPEVLYETVICYDDPDIILDGIVVAITEDAGQFVVDGATIKLDAETDEVTATELIESSLTGEKYVGNFKTSCLLDEFDPSELLYVVTTATFTEKTLSLKDEFFQDTDCSVPATPAETVVTGDLFYPGGVQQTSLGGADFLNISLATYTQDGLPLPFEEDQLLSAAGFYDLVLYTIIFIDGDALYIGDIADDDLGLSPSRRATRLDLLPILRQ